MWQGGGSDVDGITLAADSDVPAVRYPRVAVRQLSAGVERRVRTAEAALRCAACGLAVVAAVVLVVNRESHVFFGSYVKVARYTDMPSFVFLVIASGIATCCNLVQGARCLVSTARGSALVSRPLAWAIFSCDQVMAYVVICAVAAALETAAIGKSGQPEFGWMQTAILYKRFSMRAGIAIVCAVAASVAMVAVSAVSAFNLFRLYGDGKGRNN